MSRVAGIQEKQHQQQNKRKPWKKINKGQQRAPNRVKEDCFLKEFIDIFFLKVGGRVGRRGREKRAISSFLSWLSHMAITWDQSNPGCRLLPSFIFAFIFFCSAWGPFLVLVFSEVQRNQSLHSQLSLISCKEKGLGDEGPLELKSFSASSVSSHRAPDAGLYIRGSSKSFLKTFVIVITL